MTEEKPEETAGPNGKLSAWMLSHFPRGYVGGAVDVGASDGYSVNSTYLMEAEHGWKVLCIEPNPYWLPSLLQRRQLVMACACDSEPRESADFHVHLDLPEAYSALRPTLDHPKWKPLPEARWETIQVPVKTLEQCLEESRMPQLDALCIDTEGTELEVLKGIDLDRWQPRVVVVESWDSGALDEYMKSFGYRREYRTWVNDCYVRRIE